MAYTFLDDVNRKNKQKDKTQLKFINLFKLSKYKQNCDFDYCSISFSFRMGKSYFVGNNCVVVMK